MGGGPPTLKSGRKAEPPDFSNLYTFNNYNTSKVLYVTRPHTLWRLQIPNFPSKHVLYCCFSSLKLEPLTFAGHSPQLEYCSTAD